MRKLPFFLLLAAIFFAATGIASADVRRGGVDDALGDTAITLGGERLADVERVEAEYDGQAGKVSVIFKLREALPRSYSANISVSVAQTDAGGVCQAAKSTGDIEITGYLSQYDSYATYSSVYVSGVGIAQSTGLGTVSSDRTRLTVSAQGSPLANLGYRCLTNLTHTEYDYSSGASAEDKIAQFFIAAVGRACPLRPPASSPSRVSPRSATRPAARARPSPRRRGT